VRDPHTGAVISTVWVGADNLHLPLVCGPLRCFPRLSLGKARWRRLPSDNDWTSRDQAVCFALGASPVPSGQGLRHTQCCQTIRTIKIDHAVRPRFSRQRGHAPAFLTVTPVSSVVNSSCRYFWRRGVFR
jgi:hypothetical protein